MKRRVFALCLALVLAVGSLGGGRAQAADGGCTQDTAEAAAQALYELGLLQGMGALPDGSPNFALESTATRGQAVTMLVRLLGAEEEALKSSYPHPFTDAGWASPYVGYAYANGISAGMSADTFGTDVPVSVPQFLTLVLRAMGYTQVDWRDPYPTAQAIGLEYPDGICYRSSMAFICYSALFCPVEGGGETLRQRLAGQGVIEAPYADRGFGPATPLVTAITASSPEEAVCQFAYALDGRCQNSITMLIPAGMEQVYMDYIGANMDAFSEIHYLSATSTEWGVIVFQATYGDAERIAAYLEGKLPALEQEDMAALEAALQIYDSLVTEDMTDYEKLKAFHDYLVNHTTYANGERAHAAAGALLDGQAVCDGYSHAFDLLCYLGGIDCIRICGTANGGGHAWNMVQLDGAWYHVDVTWDDPISSRPLLLHDYFLVSDRTLSKDHQWTQYSHWPEAPGDYTP